jgi:acetolactate synthase I/II/III large subunit
MRFSQIRRIWGAELKPGLTDIGSAENEKAFEISKQNEDYQNTITAAEVIVQHLESQGVEYIFGIPGGAIEPLNNALSKSKIQVIVSKHEAGSAFMADGYARVSGKIGVCCSTSGPGATNLVTGIASSMGDSIPVIALTGQVATSVLGQGAVQEFSIESLGIVGLFRHVTKYSDVIINENKAEDMTAKAIRIALSGRKGPVHLNLPSDILKKNVYVKHDRFSMTETGGFDRDQIREAAKLLIEAERPVILAGWGAVLSRADRELLELAEMMDIPVATSPKGKGIISEMHPLSLGTLGFAGAGASEEYIVKKDVDVMFAVGTSFNEWMTSGWDRNILPSKALIQVDIEPDEIGKNFYVTCGVAGDAKVVLRELTYELRRQLSGKTPNERNSPRKEVRLLQEKYMSADKIPAGLPYKPQRLLLDLENSLPDDTLFFADNGSSMAWAINRLRIKAPYKFYAALGFASMGYAVAAPIGAKLAAGDKPVVALVGDGSFLMNGMEVATAVNYNIPVIWVIMNNSMLGMVYHGRKLAGLPEGIGSTFKQVDFVKIAEGLGARAIRITRPGEINKNLMDEIIESGAPAVLDVIIDAEEIPPIQSRIAVLEKLYN